MSSLKNTKASFVFYSLLMFVGPLGIEPSPNAPKAFILPIYYGPKRETERGSVGIYDDVGPRAYRI